MRLAYIQVGGKADGAADAAPSPSALRASGAEAKRTPERNSAEKRKSKAATARAFAADPLGESPAYTVALSIDSYLVSYAMSLSGVVRSLRGLPYRYIRLHPSS